MPSDSNIVPFCRPSTKSASVVATQQSDASAAMTTNEAKYTALRLCLKLQILPDDNQAALVLGGSANDSNQSVIAAWLLEESAKEEHPSEFDAFNELVRCLNRETLMTDI